MAYQGVIFDLDGTLLDTLADIAVTANQVLQSQGLPAHPVDAYRKFTGDGLAILMQRVLPRDAAHLVPVCVTGFHRLYETNWNQATRLYPGIAEMLDAIVLHKLRMAVLSNKAHGFTAKCVTAYLSRWRFDPVWGLQEHTPRKPDPAGALKIAADWRVAPRDILYVGDTNVDMRTAAAAGMDAAGVLWGFRDREELAAGGAKWIIEHPAEIVSILDGANRG